VTAKRPPVETPRGFPGHQEALPGWTVRYDIQLPDKQTKRVPDSVDHPVTANKEVVKRNLGDIFQFEFMGKYEFAQPCQEA